jgi:hypothetical protein
MQHVTFGEDGTAHCNTIREKEMAIVVAFLEMYDKAPFSLPKVCLLLTLKQHALMMAMHKLGFYCCWAGFPLRERRLVHEARNPAVGSALH